MPDNSQDDRVKTCQVWISLTAGFAMLRALELIGPIAHKDRSQCYDVDRIGQAALLEDGIEVEVTHPRPFAMSERAQRSSSTGR